VDVESEVKAEEKEEAESEVKVVTMKEAEVEAEEEDSEERGRRRRRSLFTLTEGGGHLLVCARSVPLRKSRHCEGAEAGTGCCWRGDGGIVYMFRILAESRR
jgi:hypothetical protein